MSLPVDMHDKSWRVGPLLPRQKGVRFIPKFVHHSKALPSLSLSLPLFLSLPLSLSLFFSFTHTLSYSLYLVTYQSLSHLFIFFLCQSIYSAPFVKRILFQTLSLSLSLFFTLPYPYPSFSSCLSPKTVQKRHYLSQDRRIFYSNIFLFCN